MLIEYFSKAGRVGVCSFGKYVFRIGTLIALSLSSFALPQSSSAVNATATELDYPTTSGHFYTQANGYPLGAHDYGFEITNEDGIPFWSVFDRLGRSEKLGYPISNRYDCSGFVCQATQRGILQWDPLSEQVTLLNTLELIAQLGHDEWLRAQAFVPPATGLSPDPLGDFSAIYEHRVSQLVSDWPIYNAYVSDKRSLELYGLPVSSPQTIGQVVAVRFQRNVLYRWVGNNTVIAALAGDLAKQVGIVPAGSCTPQPPPFRALHGVATWYGEYFHGNVMANGQVYDMYDPTTAASNLFPFDTQLQVTRLDNGKSIIVRVTDRGAFRYPILVDLSWAAFGELGLPAEGVIKISVRAVDSDIANTPSLPEIDLASR